MVDWIYPAGVFAALVIYMIIGNIVGRYVKTTDDYYVMGRRAPTILVLGSLVASYLSTVAFMGEVGFSYDGYVIPYLILVSINVTGYVFGVYLFGRYIRRAKNITVPQFFGERFDSDKIRVLLGLITIVGLATYLVAITQGMAILFSELLGVDFLLALLIVWIVYTSFTIYAGSPGVLITDTTMFLTFLAAAIFAMPFVIQAAGGWPDAITNAAMVAGKPGLLKWHGVISTDWAYWKSASEVLVWAIVIGIVWAFVVAVSPWQSSRYLMAKNEQVVLRSGLSGMVVVMIILAILNLSMVTVNVVNPNISPSERVFVWAAMNIFPTWMGILALTGIAAAGLSSCSTFLSLVGFSAAADCYAVYAKRKMHNYKGVDEEKYKKWKEVAEGGKTLLGISRLIMLLVSLAVLISAYLQPPAVFWIGYRAATLFATAMGPVAFLGVHKKWVTKRGAFWGILVGFLSNILWKELVYDPMGLSTYYHPVIIGLVLSTLAVIIGSKTTKPTEAELKYFEKLHIPVEKVSISEIKRTNYYAYAAILGGLAIMIFLYVFYYIPLPS